jgi:ribosome-interacting GTPase 1
MFKFSFFLFLFKKNNFLKEIFNGEVLFREDCTADEFIDVIVGNRVYMPCVYVNKMKIY